MRGLQSCAVAVGAGGVDGRRGAKGAAFCVLSGTFLAGCVGATVAVVIAWPPATPKPVIALTSAEFASPA